ncbi:MAG: hypothetical protein WCK01_01050 [Candidatus Uhrbacteria bacterium]
MRNLFITMVLGLVLVGCYESHGISFVPVIPMGDSGPYVGGDASPMEPDAGPIVMVDAGLPEVDAGTHEGIALRVVFNGPAESMYLRGSQDVVMYHFTLTAYEALEIRNLSYTVEGLTADDRVSGSLGSEYFRDRKIKNADTGETVMGPIDPGTSTFTDSFAMTAGETVDLLVTMDLANVEDAFAEFYGDGNNRYRVTFGDASGHFFGSSSVRRIATGEFLPPEAIENNIRMPGNEIMVADTSLAINMASTPSSTVAVKRQPMIPSVGIVFTASAASDVLIRSVQLTGTGNIAGAFVLADLHNVVTYCALFDGVVQVGLAESPDAVTGQMNITGVNYTIPAGSSVTLEARCTADSIVALADGDHYAIGIASAHDVVAERSEGFSVTPTLAFSLINNMSEAPTNIVTVRQHGTITIASDNLRQSTILVAGGDVWQNFAQYKATAQYEAMDADVIRVRSVGDAAAFMQVAVAMDGYVLGTCILPAGINQSCDVRLSSTFHVERDSSRTFQLWGKLNTVVSSASVSGATVGVLRSGSRIALGLASDVVVGEWDTSYTSMLNMRITGAASGDRIYANGPARMGNDFIVRRTKPVVTRQALSTTTLSNGSDQDLIRFQVSADSAGAIGVMGFRFRMYVTGSGTVSSLRVRRGSSDLPASDVTVTYDGTYVVIAFTSEQTIAGSGNVYTLHGMVNGFIAGDSISTSFYRDSTNTQITGYVGSDAMVSGTIGSIMAGMLWSDMSEIPHSPATMALGGSMDWTNETLVEDMTQTQVLSR